MNKFDDWLIKRDVKNEDAAKRLGISVSHMSRLRSGKRRPGPGLDQRIFDYTKGGITPNDFCAFIGEA